MRREHGALVAWITLASVQVVAVFSLGGRAEAAREPLYEYEFAVGSVLAYGFLVGLTLAIALLYDDPWPAVGVRSFRLSWLWPALGVIVLVVLIGVALALAGVDPAEEQGLAPRSWRPDRVEALAVNALVVTVVVPFAEELFFRGLGVRALAPLGAGVAVAGTAVAFALGHGILAAVPPLVVFGLGLGWIRLRSRSVWPGVVAHGTYNGVALVFALASL